MKGVILAGGKGSRLAPATDVMNKSMALVYDRLMIEYPLETLREYGCDSAVIVSSPTGVGDMSRYLKDGEAFGLDLEYVVQREARGIADAIGACANKLSGVFPLILGDCYYDPAPPVQTEATLLWHDYEFADQHSVWNPETDAIIEKPRLVQLGSRAIIGYFYDEQLFDFAEQVQPAQSGELEIVDIHNMYREAGAQMVEYEGFFGDMGTPDGLLRVANHEAQR